MLYTVANTVDLGRPVACFTDGEGVEHAAYFLEVDTETGRCIRVVRKDGGLVFDGGNGEALTEEVYLPLPITITFQGEEDEKGPEGDAGTGVHRSPQKTGAPQIRPVRGA